MLLASAGLEKEAKLSPELVAPLHAIIVSVKVHPVIVSTFVQRFICKMFEY